MYGNIKEHLQKEIQEIKDNGLFKTERIITSPQGAEITINTGDTVLNFCSNNYLGLLLIHRLFKRQKMPWILMVLECLQFVLYAAPKISTKS